MADSLLVHTAACELAGSYVFLLYLAASVGIVTAEVVMPVAAGDAVYHRVLLRFYRKCCT